MQKKYKVSNLSLLLLLFIFLYLNFFILTKSFLSSKVNSLSVQFFLLTLRLAMFVELFRNSKFPFESLKLRRKWKNVPSISI